MERYLISILICIAVIMILVFGIAYIAYRMAFYADRRKQEDIYEMSPGMDQEKDFPVMKALIDEMVRRPYERVYISGKDGTKLSARYYHVKEGSPLQIHCHGYRGTSVRDFSGGNKLAHEAGHNVLVIDQRAHGKSEGNTITFGIKERYDCLCWVEYAVERFGSEIPVILCGISMGSATVLMASALDLPGNVVGITADCPYSSPEKIILKVCKDMKIPPGFIAPFLRLGAKVFGHFDLNEMTVTEAVKNKKVPVLLIHGEADTFVPCEMSREIYDACPEPKRLETFAGADHGLSYIADPVRFKKVHSEFIEEILQQTIAP